jgi:phage gp36-like protein
MAYATQQQIQIAAGGSAKLIELTDQEGTSAVDAAVLAEAQAKADGWINGYLRLRYAIPVTPLSVEGQATLSRLAADETVYQLLFARRLLADQDMKARADRELELGEYRDGKRRLDEPMPMASSATPAQYVEYCGPMSRKGLGDIF